MLLVPPSGTHRIDTPIRLLQLPYLKSSLRVQVTDPIDHRETIHAGLDENTTGMSYRYDRSAD